MSSDVSTARRWVVRVLVPVWLVLIHGVPVALSAAWASTASDTLGSGLALVLAGPLYIVLMPVIAGGLSMTTRWAIVPGRFPRDLGHRIYGPRRLYALCWTSVYYHPVVYHVVLALPWLKRLVFRLFGYSGPLGFSLYPDTWIRDLPLLHVGSGAYLSNRATVSPNMCLKDGTTLVAPVRIGARSLIGHLALIGPGVSIGDDVEIGVASALSVGVTVGDRSRVGHCSAIDRKVRIGAGCRLVECARVGAGSIVEEETRTPFGLTVAPRSSLGAHQDLHEIARGQGIARAGPSELDGGRLARRKEPADVTPERAGARGE